MVRLYIDPGTGSMLFTVFIGIISAAVYVARAVIIKIKNSVGAGKKIQADKNKIPIVIFSDHKRYFTTFKPICDELDKKGIALNRGESESAEGLDDPMAYKETQYDLLADTLREHLDMDKIYGILFGEA